MFTPGAAPDLEVLTGQIAAFRGEDRDGWSGPARRSRAVELLAAAHELTAAATEAVRDADRDQAWQADYANALHWLAVEGRMTRADATRRLASARLLAEQDATAKAFTTGEISVGALDQLAKARNKREATYAEHETVLLDSARTVPVDQLPKAVKRWAAIHDDLHTNRELADTGSRLFVATTFAGCVKVDALLEADDGAVFLEALRQATDAPTEDDDRSQPERRAAALLSLMTGAKTVEVGVDVVVDVRTLDGDLVPPHEARCDLALVGPVPLPVIQRLLCDCKAGRVLTAGPSLPLDVGRRERVVTKAMLRALTLRDGGCRYQGCGRPASFCDAHHIIAWSDGGETKLDNLVLVCRRHHTRIHHGDTHLVRNPDGTIDLRAHSP